MSRMSVLGHSPTHSREAGFLAGISIIVLSLSIVTPCPLQLLNSKQCFIAQSSASVFIDGNQSFRQQGWPGNGSETNPYIIEGLTFDESLGTCIRIGNVSASFEIRNCRFRNTAGSEDSLNEPVNADIWLDNVVNARIEVCSFLGDACHIVAYNSSMLGIESCIVNGGSVGYFRNSDMVQVRNSTISAEGGINVLGTSYCLISDNNINIGIHTQFSDWFYPSSTEAVYANQPSDWFSIDDTGTTNITGNCFTGDLGLLISSSKLVFDSNVVTGQFALPLDFFDLLLHHPVLSMTGNRFGSGGFVAKYNRAIDNTLENATISGNYADKKPILFLRDKSETSVDLSVVAQLIAYRCEGLRIFGSTDNATEALFLEDCVNSTLAGISISHCLSGAMIYGSRRIEVSSFSISSADQGLLVSHSENVSLRNGEISACTMGADIESSNGTLITSCRFTNDSIGLQTAGTAYSIIYDNMFDCQDHNVVVLPYSWSESATDRWDYNGTGNSWNDYIAGGSYIVGFGYGWTVADHHPSALSASSAFTLVAEDLAVSLLIVALAGLGPGLLLLRSRMQIGPPPEFNARMWGLGSVLVMFIPTMVTIGNDAAGNAFWCLSTPIYSIWSDLGYIYSSGPMIMSHISYFLTFTVGAPIISIFLSELAIAAALRRKKGDQGQVVLLIVAFVLLAWGSYGLLVPMALWQYFTTSIQIPLPIGIVAVYFLFKKVKPIEALPLEIPKRTNEIKVVCPQCGAVYYYKHDAMAEGSVICQNCNKRINNQDSPSDA